MVTSARLQVFWLGAPPRCDPSCGSAGGSRVVLVVWVEGCQEKCALSADVDGARRFENTGLHHVPKLHGELYGAGDPLRGCRGRGWRTGSSALSMKRRSSSLFDRCEDHSTRFHRVTSVMHHNLGSTPHACSTAREFTVCTLACRWFACGRVSLNSVNSVGDTEDGRRRFCVSG